LFAILHLAKRKEDSGSPCLNPRELLKKGGLLFVVGGIRENPHLGQSQEASCYCDKYMLHVQEDGGVHRPSSSSLQCGFCLLVLSFQSLWVDLDYVTTGYRSTCLLVVFGPVEECCDVENGAHLPLLVLMEGNK
jgi:hypothetical protein